MDLVWMKIIFFDSKFESFYAKIYFTNDINVINKFKRISNKIFDYDNNIEIILNNLSYRPVELFLLRIFYIILYYFI